MSATAIGKSPFSDLLAEVSSVPKTLARSQAAAASTTTAAIATHAGRQYTGGDYLPYLQVMTFNSGPVADPLMMNKIKAGDIVLFYNKKAGEYAVIGGNGLDPAAGYNYMYPIAMRAKAMDMRQDQASPIITYDVNCTLFAECRNLAKEPGLNNALAGFEFLVFLIPEKTEVEPCFALFYFANATLLANVKTVSARCIFDSDEPEFAGQPIGLRTRYIEDKNDKKKKWMAADFTLAEDLPEQPTILPTKEDLDAAIKLFNEQTPVGTAS